MGVGAAALGLGMIARAPKVDLREPWEDILEELYEQYSVYGHTVVTIENGRIWMADKFPIRYSHIGDHEAFSLDKNDIIAERATT